MANDFNGDGRGCGPGSSGQGDARIGGDPDGRAAGDRVPAVAGGAGDAGSWEGAVSFDRKISVRKISIGILFTCILFLFMSPAYANDRKNDETMKNISKTKNSIKKGIDNKLSAENLINIGCKSKKIPFFDHGPDKKTHFHDKNSNINILHYGKNQISVFNQNGVQKIDSIRIEKKNYPKSLLFLFDKNIIQIKEMIDLKECNISEINITCYFEGTDISIDFKSDMPSTIIWSCTI